MESDSIQKRLEPDHLPTTAELKAQIETQPAEAAVDPNDDPKAKTEYSFDFDYTDARGKKWVGRFTHRVPTLAQRDVIDLMQARKKLGMPVSSFSGMAAERHLMMCHLEMCLTEKPKWAESLDGIHDPTIIEKLYGEAASHEAFFLGWGTDSAGGEE